MGRTQRAREHRHQPCVDAEFAHEPPAVDPFVLNVCAVCPPGVIDPAAHRRDSARRVKSARRRLGRSASAVVPTAGAGAGAEQEPAPAPVPDRPASASSSGSCYRHGSSRCRHGSKRHHHRHPGHVHTGSRRHFHSATGAHESGKPRRHRSSSRSSSRRSASRRTKERPASASASAAPAAAAAAAPRQEPPRPGPDARLLNGCCWLDNRFHSCSEHRGFEAPRKDASRPVLQAEPSAAPISAYRTYRRIFGDVVAVPYATAGPVQAGPGLLSAGADGGNARNWRSTAKEAMRAVPKRAVYRRPKFGRLPVEYC